MGESRSALGALRENCYIATTTRRRTPICAQPPCLSAPLPTSLLRGERERKRERNTVAIQPSDWNSSIFPTRRY